MRPPRSPLSSGEVRAAIPAYPPLNHYMMMPSNIGGSQLIFSIPWASSLLPVQEGILQFSYTTTLIAPHTPGPEITASSSFYLAAHITGKHDARGHIMGKGCYLCPADLKSLGKPDFSRSQW